MHNLYFQNKLSVILTELFLLLIELLFLTEISDRREGVIIPLVFQDRLCCNLSIQLSHLYPLRYIERFLHQLGM